MSDSIVHLSVIAKQGYYGLSTLAVIVIQGLTECSIDDMAQVDAGFGFALGSRTMPSIGVTGNNAQSTKHTTCWKSRGGCTSEA